jgi:hypothetical protein
MNFSAVKHWYFWKEHKLHCILRRSRNTCWGEVFKRLGNKWEDNKKVQCKEMWCEGVHWIKLVQVRTNKRRRRTWYWNITLWRHIVRRTMFIFAQSTQIHHTPYTIRLHVLHVSAYYGQHQAHRALQSHCLLSAIPICQCLHIGRALYRYVVCITPLCHEMY